MIARGANQNNMSSTATSVTPTTTTTNQQTIPPNAYGYKERRREAHTQAEQKRRDAIKKGYEDLQYMVPTCQQQDSISSYKLSKATILQRSIEYIQALQKSKSRHENELKTLRKEVCALQIMKANYEQMLKQHQLTALQQHGQAGNRISEQIKFEIFQAFCDNLFASFDRFVTFGDFKQLSASIFTWLEEHGKPQTLRDMCLSMLRDFFTVAPQTIGHWVNLEFYTLHIASCVVSGDKCEEHQVKLVISKSCRLITRRIAHLWNRQKVFVSTQLKQLGIVQQTCSLSDKVN